MEPVDLPHQAIAASTRPHLQAVYALTGLLPASRDDTLAAMPIRDHASILKAAALLPVNASQPDPPLLLRVLSPLAYGLARQFHRHRAQARRC